MITEAKFWARVNKTMGCWEWTGGRTDGYGVMYVGKEGKRRIYKKAHRISYELNVGVIPPGMVIDHLCRNPACVRPEHLEPVTIRENTLRGRGRGAVYRLRSACINGHEFDEKNTLLRQTRTGAVARVCRTCRNEASKKAKRKR